MGELSQNGPSDKRLGLETKYRKVPLLRAYLDQETGVLISFRSVSALPAEPKRSLSSLLLRYCNLSFLGGAKLLYHLVWSAAIS